MNDPLPSALKDLTSEKKLSAIASEYDGESEAKYSSLDESE
jgi:hypothetical protein